MELAVISIAGQDTGRKVTLNDEIFGIEPNNHVMYLDVKQYLANQRQGTHKSKERAEISRTTKKLHKQKGTGGARHGSRKSPLFIGGGRVFGPRPRDYHFKLNKKVKALARKSALSYKASMGKLSVLEAFNFDTPKTKNFVGLLNALQLQHTKTLLVLPEVNQNVYLASRNLQKARVITISQLNTYEVLNADTLIVSEDSVARFAEIFNAVQS